MTTLRNAKGYNIGLDIGTGSVGWAVTSLDGELLRFKGRPTWGSRLFDNASPAKGTRIYRGQRRRYDRRRQRLNYLQMMFANEIYTVDPDFFVRLNQSRLHREDRVQPCDNYRWPLFNPSHPLIIDGQQITEATYYKLFPTIYHLRAWLVRTSDKADIRLIYLAFHNIIKARGNFLYQDLGNEGLSAHGADMSISIERFASVFDQWLSMQDIDRDLTDFEIDQEALEQAFSQQGLHRQQRQDLIKQTFQAKGEVQKKIAAALTKAFLGYTANFTYIFDVTEADGKAYTFSLSDDEKSSEFSQACPETGLELFESIKNVYSSFVLQGILHIAHADAYWKSAIQQTQLEGMTFDVSSDFSISVSKVIEYGRYHEDLVLLKRLVDIYYPGPKVPGQQKTLHSAVFNEFFRGPYLIDPHTKKAVRGQARAIPQYDPQKAKGYTKYNAGESKLGYKNFAKEVAKLFGLKVANGKIAAIDELGKKTILNEDVKRMLQGFEEETFLRRLKTSDNGVIPYQLHLEEMHAIIKKQAAFYPFLNSTYTTQAGVTRNKIESLVAFRIPYYVGPLTQKNAAKDASGKNRFAWSVRQHGKEHTSVHPWDWDDVIDKGASADAFMRRMIGSCTYLWGEPVLPKCSLLYEKYCVLNELNGAHYRQGTNTYRFDTRDRRRIFEDLFCRKDAVSYKAVADWMKQHNCVSSDVSGGQGKTGFKSKLTSYRFFCELLGKARLSQEDEIMAETIIEWNSLFEDRAILREKVMRAYGGGSPLSDDQVQAVCRKRFSGWGRLSKKLLRGIKIDADGTCVSVMDVLEKGYPMQGTKGETMRFSQAMVLMEILHDDTLGFQEKIDEHNMLTKSDRKLEIDDLPYASPALRRSINQAIRIVEEIVSIAKQPPTHIFVESTRDDDPKKKGKRTTSRAKRVKEQLNALKEEQRDQRVIAELNRCADKLDDDRLMLYFLQNGKCLYSGRALDIKSLSHYQIDHIIPQSYIKDDSLENRALVCAEENQRKKDTLLLDSSVQKKMCWVWRDLYKAGLMGKKKYHNLMRTKIDDRQAKNFINRQLVETSQIVKFVVQLLQQCYPKASDGKGTDVRTIKASLSHQLRQKWDDAARRYVWRFPKVREMNDYHHAHDAYLAAELGRFINKRFAYLYDNPIKATHIMRTYIKSQAEECLEKKRTPAFCFIASSFLLSGFDKETGEIFRDDWDAEKELARMRTYFSLPDCFISRMPTIDTGAFSDATLYSPRDHKMGAKLKLALKKGLDPHKYGGFSREEFAYFFIFEKKDKKGRQRLEFAAVPVRVADRVNACGKITLERYAVSLLEDNESLVCITRPRLYKNQLLEIHGERFYLRGAEEVRNARELAFGLADAQLIDDLLHKRPTSVLLRLELFDECAKKIARFAPRLAKSLKLESYRDAFAQADEAIQCQVLLNVLANANASKNAIDLSGISGVKNAGRLNMSFNKLLNDKEAFYVIDASVTGMFESKVKVELAGTKNHGI